MAFVVGLALLAGGGEAPDVTTSSHHLEPGPAIELGTTSAIPSRTSPVAWKESWTDMPLRVGGFRVPLRTMAIPALPGSTLDLAVGESGAPITVSGEGGRLRRESPRLWRWTAPRRPGVHRLQVTSAADTVDLHMLVLRPASDVRDGALGAYPIGSYKPRPPARSVRYEPPAGFIEAAPELFDLPVSPHFTLGQFLCKQPGDPQYLLVSPRLLIKLERLLEEVNGHGIQARTLTVMSGFRTPAYNRAIGNVTDFSRHLFGDAADVFVDVDGDGQMDDLDGDGRSTIADARWLGRLVESLAASTDVPVEAGGIAAYRRNAVHGPFLHIDTRGSRARW